MWLRKRLSIYGRDGNINGRNGSVDDRDGNIDNRRDGKEEEISEPGGDWGGYLYLGRMERVSHTESSTLP